jgi:hypothetical protein
MPQQPVGLIGRFTLLLIGSAFGRKPFFEEKYVVNRWEALTKIVASFNEAKRPWHALVAVLALGLPFALLAGVAVALLK